MDELEVSFFPIRPPDSAHQVVAALRAGEWAFEPILARLHRLVRKHRQWTRPFLKRLLQQMPEVPDAATLLEWVAADRGFRKAQSDHPLRAYWCEPAPATMAPKNTAAQSWRVPRIVSEAELCAWLRLPPEKLLWLADVAGLEHRQTREPLRNYYYRWIPKRSFGCRLIEAPKALLKSIQRRLLAEILDRIPPHAAAKGFAPGSSVFEHVEGHCKQDVVLRLDLKDFFPSVRAARVHAIFTTAGYPADVARVLTGLCTNTTPLEVMARCPERMNPALAQQFRTPHLPQGAPVSPALANLCAYRLDVRLSGLARRFDWFYTRYADDLLFSGPKQSRGFARRLQIWAGAIALEEGFCVNMRKTRILGRASRQHAAGLVLNERPNIPRDEFDVLKATLFNCARRGPAGENRTDAEDFRAHLLGRIGYVAQVHPARGAKLRALYQSIEWPQEV